ncbi:MAG: c-type cytochrome [Caldilineaceae bacterium]|nr:c-type cytochrome [Caldilineaceae bacterium]
MNWLRQHRLMGVALLSLVLGSLLAACAPDPATSIITPDLGPQLIAAARAKATGMEQPEAPALLTLADMSDEEIYAGLDGDLAAAIQAADPAGGETLATANACIGCHSLDPDVVMTGPTWHNIGDTAVNRVAGESPAYYLYQSIIDPNAYVVTDYPAGIMTQTYQDTLSQEDLATLIAYLLSLHGAGE